MFILKVLMRNSSANPVITDESLIDRYKESMSSKHPVVFCQLIAQNNRTPEELETAFNEDFGNQEAELTELIKKSEELVTPKILRGRILDDSNLSLLDDGHISNGDIESVVENRNNTLDANLDDRSIDNSEEFDSELLLSRQFTVLGSSTLNDSGDETDSDEDVPANKSLLKNRTKKIDNEYEEVEDADADEFKTRGNHSEIPINHVLDNNKAEDSIIDNVDITNDRDNLDNKFNINISKDLSHNITEQLDDSTVKKKSYPIYVVCRLPKENKIFELKFQNTCTKQPQFISIDFKPSQSASVIRIKRPIRNDNTRDIFYFLNDMPYNINNTISFDEDSCALSISSVRMLNTLSIALAVMALIFH